jgi:hypothetical protein
VIADLTPTEWATIIAAVATSLAAIAGAVSAWAAWKAASASRESLNAGRIQARIGSLYAIHAVVASMLERRYEPLDRSQRISQQESMRRELRALVRGVDLELPKCQAVAEWTMEESGPVMQPDDELRAALAEAEAAIEQQRQATR